MSRTIVDVDAKARDGEAPEKANTDYSLTRDYVYHSQPLGSIDYICALMYGDGGHLPCPDPRYTPVGEK